MSCGACYYEVTSVMPNNDTSLLHHVSRWIVLFLVSIGVIILAIFFQDKLSQFRSLGLLGIFLANVLGSATLFLPAPAIVTVIAGGIVYPPILVGLVGAMGATIGDMVGYVVGFSGEKVFLKKDYGFYTTFTHIMKRFGGIVIFIFAFFPNPLFDAIGITSGVLGYSVTKFFLWTFLGRLVRNLLLAYFGTRIGFLVH